MSPADLSGTLRLADGIRPASKLSSAMSRRRAHSLSLESSLESSLELLSLALSLALRFFVALAISGGQSASVGSA